MNKMKAILKVGKAASPKLKIEPASPGPAYKQLLALKRHYDDVVKPLTKEWRDLTSTFRKLNTQKGPEDETTKEANRKLTEAKLKLDEAKKPINKAGGIRKIEKTLQAPGPTPAVVIQW